MKSKLENSIAELYKLKNQIRVELNQLRPQLSPLTIEKRDHSTKKLFGNKYQNTDIIHPSAEKSEREKKERRRYIDRQSQVHTATSRSMERKHYGQHYADRVNLDNSIRKRTSSYLIIRKQPDASPTRHQNTSLSGIGAKDKSNSQKQRLCIRTYHA